MQRYLSALNIIFALEVIIVALASFGIIPREAVLFLTGLMVFYIIFSPVEDSLYLVIMSIPLFVALPFGENFDSMANWRILVAVLFLCLFFKKGVSLSLVRNDQGKWRIRKNIGHGVLEYLTLLLLAISLISIFFADFKILGVKKLLFLVNIFLLFLIIKNVAQNKDIVIKILKSAAIGVSVVIFVALAQFIAVLFVPLYTFWQFWAGRVIVLFYGKNLSDLLSYSNTWFAYYSGAPPTLRLFSVFPDSHSFAMFLILAVPVFMTLAVYSKNKSCSNVIPACATPAASARRAEAGIQNYNAPQPLLKLRGGAGALLVFFWWLMTVLALSGIVLSGSRGAWLSVLPVIAMALYLWKPGAKKFLAPGEPVLAKKAIWAFGLFMAIFLLSSFYPPMLYKFQSWQSGQNVSSTFSFFQRAKSISDLDEISNKGRLEIWQTSLKSLIKYPVLGVGLGNYVTVLDEDISAAKKGVSAHNLYLDFANEIGIFGALILGLIFLEILQASWQVFRRANEEYFISFGFLCGLYFLWVIVYSLFDVVLLNDKVFLFFMVGAGTLYSIKCLIEKENAGIS